MQIKKIEIADIRKDGFTRAPMDGERHIKELPYLSVVQSTYGCYSFAAGDGETGDTAEGGFFIAPAFTRQDITHHGGADGTMSARWVFLDVRINGIPADRLYDFPPIPEPAVSAEIAGVMDEIFATDDAIDVTVACLRLMKIIIAAGTPKRAVDPKTEAAVRYIGVNYGSEITVADIAAHLHISPSRLHAVFKSATGTSPVAYLTAHRLSRACLLLESTSLPIAGVAARCGIPDMFYFSRQFKAAYGIPPSEYRRKVGKSH